MVCLHVKDARDSFVVLSSKKFSTAHAHEVKNA
uniref:DUF1508 domain-containing protein n=1 Tax=Angiostrongylus cantonensis TaxID=6313 RepID=A0A158P9Q6_ANGCA